MIPNMSERHTERLHKLTECGPNTQMGNLLRCFWHPITVSSKIKAGEARHMSVLGEDLTIYRGESGRAYAIGGRCAHRRTVLHTGWVQGEEIRCIYHGWKYDQTGQCTEAPAEGGSFSQNVKIAGYKVREYAGLIFVFMGDPTQADLMFELQRKPEYEDANNLIIAREQTWPANFFQQIENSLDAVHVSFVHRAGKVGPLGAAVTEDIPTLEYLETSAGIRQIAQRSATNIRVSDWTFPNYNHIVTPGRTKESPWVHRGVWNVPATDTSTLKLGVYAIPSQGRSIDDETVVHFEKYGGYNPADHHDALFERRDWPEDHSLQLTPAQDYVAIKGQGEIVDRGAEYLGSSDAGIVLLRRIFWREMEAMESQSAGKKWVPLAARTELPIQVIANEF
jgi:5,5'-dehydrodivanillate O-demethylase